MHGDVTYELLLEEHRCYHRSGPMRKDTCCCASEYLGRSVVAAMRELAVQYPRYAIDAFRRF